MPTTCTRYSQLGGREPSRRYARMRERSVFFLLQVSLNRYFQERVAQSAPDIYLATYPTAALSKSDTVDQTKSESIKNTQIKHCC